MNNQATRTGLGNSILVSIVTLKEKLKFDGIASSYNEIAFPCD